MSGQVQVPAHKWYLQNKGAGAIEGDANNPDNPMDILFSCPTKPKETGRHAEYGEQSRNKTVFLGAEAVGDDVRFEIEVNIGAVDYDTNNAGDDDADEHYA